MKLRCIRIVDEKSGKVKERSPWLTVGKIYTALSLFMDERKTMLVRLVGDDGKTPGLCRLDQFAIESSNIPSNWVIDWRAGVFELAPARWLVDGFWERYFDGEKDALLVFDEERRRSEES